MSQPQPMSLSFSSLINDIEKGVIKIPQFQRDFVWNKARSAKLLDSIVKGYPIGTFILWKTDETLRVVRNIGGAKLPATPEGDWTQYVLDGQQRLTSLYAAVRGLKVERDGRIDDFAELCLDLNASEHEDIVLPHRDGQADGSTISVVDLLNATLKTLSAFPDKFHEKLSYYKNRFESYAFSAVLLTGAEIDVATEIFTRINVTGKALSVFEIMVAKTFDAKSDFDLAEKYDALQNRLRDVDYETIPEAVAMQTVAAIFAKDCTKKQILKIKKADFIECWPKAEEAIETTIDHFRTVYGIPVSRLLPYNALVVPFAYFFHHKAKPTGDQAKFLQDFFWRASLTGRYSVSLESRLGQDLKYMDQIVKGRLPKYSADYSVDYSPQFIRDNGSFSVGRSYVKAILCLLAFQEPKSFEDGHKVTIGNDWLRQANSRNYHHFFPRAYLRKKQWPESAINHVLNITILDRRLNSDISDKAPSIYMKKFVGKTPESTRNFARNMKSHLINNLDNFGIWQDDYEKFLKMRAKLISGELKKRIVPQQVDNSGQAVNTDDRDVELNDNDS